MVEMEAACLPLDQVRGHWHSDHYLLADHPLEQHLLWLEHYHHHLEKQTLLQRLHNLGIHGHSTVQLAYKCGGVWYIPCSSLGCC